MSDTEEVVAGGGAKEGVGGADEAEGWEMGRLAGGFSNWGRSGDLSVKGWSVKGWSGKGSEGLYRLYEGFGSADFK